MEPNDQSQLRQILGIVPVDRKVLLESFAQNVEVSVLKPFRTLLGTAPADKRALPGNSAPSAGRKESEQP